jgi:uncharacterized membrane protein YkoI
MRLHPVKSGTVIALALIAASLAQASGDHDRARAALERGEVRPIGEILASAAAKVPGEVVEVELEREHGHWVYELKIIGPDGRMLEVLMDAATATVIQIEDH